jgi:hypothetical protein
VLEGTQQLCLEIQQTKMGLCKCVLVPLGIGCCLHFNFLKNTVIFENQHIQVYTMALFERWFPTDPICKNPRVLGLVVLDGLLSDARKLVSVNLHTGKDTRCDNFKVEILDDKRFSPFISNIQLESANAILQGMPLVDAIADLVDQVGYAYREFYNTRGYIRKHIVPVRFDIRTTFSCI